MRNKDHSADLQKLRLLIDQSASATKDGNLRGDWGRYSRVTRYVSRRLRRVRNPNAEEFIQTAVHFDSQWQTELVEFLAQDARPKEAINSIMSLRNNIAHGGNQSISPRQVKDYLESSVKVLEFIETQCDR